ncbi:MAG: hypothetical protein HYV06_03535 [Deltaproteobacteria bacterium]|nr:hypothetical protein [Deltaproteobacteria bacterium]
MKKNLYRLLSAVFLMALPAAALADTSVDSATIFRFSQDSRPGFQKKDFTPATQFLGADFEKLGDGNLSLHLYGWGRYDLADKSYNNDRADGALTYAYAQYRTDQANGLIRFGRFFINEGIVNEHVDGLNVRSDLPLGFGISAFGGATVHTVHMPGEITDGKGDGLVGGRLHYRYKGMLELGVSGVYESDAPALNQASNQQLAASGRFGSHRLLGGDVWLNPHRMVEIMGHSSYNAETEGVAEHSYLLNVKPLKDLVLTGEFNEYRDRDLFFSSIFFAGLLDNLNDRSRTMGGRASYELNRMVEISGDFKHFTREIGKADRFGGDIRFALLDKALRTGVGYHYLRASRNFAVAPSASGSFHEARAYAMHDTKSYFAAVDAIGYFFKENINNKSSAWEVTGSLGCRLTPALALSGDVSYGKNPQFVDDMKGLIRLTYNMNYTGKGGTK